MPDLTEPPGPDVGAPAPSRAGRNLPLATAIGVLLAALVVGTVNWFPVGFVVVVEIGRAHV